MTRDDVLCPDHGNRHEMRLGNDPSGTQELRKLKTGAAVVASQGSVKRPPLPAFAASQDHGDNRQRPEENEGEIQGDRQVPGLDAERR